MDLRYPGAEMVPATAADIASVYGHGNDVTVRAWAVRLNGATVAVGGVGENRVLFCNVAPGTPKRLLVEAARAFLAAVSRVRTAPLIAVAVNPAALTHFGLEGPRMMEGQPVFIFDPVLFRERHKCTA
jgi:hypothetical protein